MTLKFINDRRKDTPWRENRFEFICRKGHEYKLFLVGTAFWIHWSDGSQWFPLVSSTRRLLIWSYRVLMDVRLRTWSGFYVQAETGQLEKVQASRYPLLMTTLGVQLPLCRWGSTCEARVPVCPQWLCSTDLSRTPFPSPMGIFLSIQSLGPFCWPGLSVLIFFSTWRHYLH